MSGFFRVLFPNLPVRGGESTLKLPPVREEKVDFLLPETAEEYKQRRKALLEEKAQRLVEENKRMTAEYVQFRDRAAELERRTGTAAEKELNRREAEPLRRNANNLQGKIKSLPDDVSRELETKIKDLARSLQNDEKKKITREGKVIYEGPPDVRTEDETQFKQQRVLFEFKSRYFIARLQFDAVYRYGPWETVPAYDNPHRPEQTGTRQRRKRWPTGEFERGWVIWVTDSVAQMSNEELVAIRDHQSR